MTTQTPTDEQLAIIKAARDTTQDLLIDALAGTGKTWTLLRLIEAVKQKTILVCAFNKRISEELKGKVAKLKLAGRVVHVKTFHSIGLGIVQTHMQGIKVDGDATENLIIRAEGRHGRPSFAIRRAAMRLLRQQKECVLPGELEPEELVALGHEYNLFGKLEEHEVRRAIELMMTAYDIGSKREEIDAIDFCDMIWLPLALKLASKSRYQAVIVDEWQDLSAPQYELVKRMVAPNGRLIMAGDLRQAIYGWRGAIGSDVRAEMEGVRGCIVKPLTMTFRCSQAVTKQAQQLVPEIRCAPDAPDGSVSTIGLADLSRSIAQGPSEHIHTYVLSRTNESLFQCAMQLWRDKVRFELHRGQDLLEPLFHLIEYKLDLRDEDKFKKSLGAWRAEQHAKAEKRSTPSTAWLAKVDEQFAMLMRAVEFTKPTGLKLALKELLSSSKTGVLLSTVHGVKGLEAERVFLLKQTFQRHQIMRWEHPEGGSIEISPEADQEELNIEYVATTRAREHLMFVDMQADKPMSTVVKNYPIGGGSPAAITLEQLEGLRDECERHALWLDSIGRVEESKGYMSRLVELTSYYTKRRALEDK